MKPLPSKTENPNGVHLKYVVAHADGTPVDPGAEFFVLRVDPATHPDHLAACRAALATYADAIEATRPQLAQEIRARHGFTAANADAFARAWRLTAAATCATNRAKGFGMPTNAALGWDGLQISLMHAELSEALEGIRKDKMDDHLPWRESVEVELADCVIRIMNYAEERGLDIPGALREKAEYNKSRPFHHGDKRF